MEVNTAVVPDAERVCLFYRHVLEINEGERESPIRQVGSKSATESASQQVSQ